MGTVTGANISNSDVIGQGKALGDPTRYGIFEHLRRAGRALTIAAINEDFDLHPNAIRTHLGVLRDAGLVIEERAAPVGRGRPAMLYRLTPGAISRWEGSGPTEELSMMLLEMIESDRSAHDVGLESGRRLGEELEGSTGAVEAMIGVGRRLGFEPTLDEGDIALHHCPFAAGAERAPDVVCALHHGLIEGVAQACDDGTRVEDLVIRDPRQAGCRIKLNHQGLSTPVLDPSADSAPDSASGADPSA